LAFGAGKASLAQVYPVKNMVVCQASAGKTTCAAAPLCGTGWHLCKASEYLARGGVTVQPTVVSWLASCIRDGSAPFVPSEQPCSTCNFNSTYVSVPVSWDCGGSPLTSHGYLHFPVKTWTACRRLGSKTAPAALWTFDLNTSKLNGAACCY